MAKVKYDVKGVDSSRSQQPKPGIYECKIVDAKVTKPEGKDRRIEMVYEVKKDKKYKGAKMYDYINLESDTQKFKLKQLLEAVHGELTKKLEKGTLDTDTLVGETVMVKVTADEYQGEYKARVNFVFNPDADEDADEDDEDFDDDDAEDDEDDEDEDEDEDDEEEEDEEEEEDDKEDDAPDLDDMDRKELRAYIKDEGLDIRVTKKMTEEDIRDAIEEALDDDDEPDYDEWSVPDLRSECDTRGLKKGGSKAVLIKRLREDDENDEDPFENDD